ncbi:MAG: benzoate 1,2-dioxygenase large subunit [Herminiimonas sp.]|nr:benzoate 1,2-dioxygenase large subunit [Herminiimonas sp.]
METRMDALAERIGSLLSDDRAAGKMQIAREAFTDEALFELEMKTIFESNWIYMCHESQISRPNDYVTSYIGRQPVIINRNKAGELGGFINACAHRGTTLCRDKKGNKSVFACSFHGWCFNSSGNLIKVREEEGAGYPENFDKKAYGLTPVPKIASYRGFVFASLNPDVPDVEEYLGGSKAFIDMIVDQAPNGIELLRGSSSYIYNGNWKLQAENGADGYHVGTVHANYMAVQSRREADAPPDAIRAVSPGGTGKRPGGFYAFENGHIVIWSQRANPEDSPNYHLREEHQSKVDPERLKWMFERSRNLGLYPNLFLMDSMSSQIRQWRPISVDKTEVTTYCYAPIGESAASRVRRIRQYEDFYNASGMATPDDLSEFQASQQGYMGRLAKWNDLSRGAQHWVTGSDDLANRSGISALMSGPKIDHEGIFMMQHKAWKERLLNALDAVNNQD